MDQVTMRKERLVEVLEANRKAHVEAFDAVWAAFHAKAQERAARLVQEIRDAKPGEHITLSLSLAVPENHEPDYLRALRMLDLEVNAEVVLREQEFAQLVMDDWGWKRQFLTTGMAYIGDTGAYPGLTSS